MHLARVEQRRKQGAAGVPSAELLTDFSTGKMPAAPSGSWRAGMPNVSRSVTLSDNGGFYTSEGQRKAADAQWFSAPQRLGLDGWQTQQRQSTNNQDGHAV
jgi:hypothetical protein